MYLEVNGASLFFDTSGDGFYISGRRLKPKPSIILSHGGPGSDHTIGRPIFSRLTELAQVFYLDHRGNGRSFDDDSSRWNLRQWGSDLNVFCEKLGVKKPIIIGTSFGGFVAISYATQFPQNIGALVLVSSAAKVDFEEIYDAHERFGGSNMRRAAVQYWENPTEHNLAAYERLKNECFGQPPSIDRFSICDVMRNPVVSEYFNGPENEHGKMDFLPDLGRVCCPALVLAGEKDPIAPPQFSQAIFDNLGTQDKRLKIYPECGHGVFGYVLDEAIVDIKDFVQEFQQNAM